MSVHHVKFVQFRADFGDPLPHPAKIRPKLCKSLQALTLPIIFVLLFLPIIFFLYY